LIISYLRQTVLPLAIAFICEEAHHFVAYAKAIRCLRLWVSTHNKCWIIIEKLMVKSLHCAPRLLERTVGRNILLNIGAVLLCVLFL
jgi:hypothetical protein